MNADGLVSAGGIVVERLTFQLYGTKCGKQGMGPASVEESDCRSNGAIEHHHGKQKRQVRDGGKK